MLLSYVHLTQSLSQLLLEKAQRDVGAPDIQPKLSELGFEPTSGFFPIPSWMTFLSLWVFGPHLQCSGAIPGSVLKPIVLEAIKPGPLPHRSCAVCGPQSHLYSSSKSISVSISNPTPDSQHPPSLYPPRAVIVIQIFCEEQDSSPLPGAWLKLQRPGSTIWEGMDVGEPSGLGNGQLSCAQS